MLPQSERLKKSSEFSAVYNLRKSVANPLLILYTGRQKTSPEVPARVGFVVSKKISKKATKRNRIKRLMREAYRNLKSNTSIRTDLWSVLIFLARPEIVDVNYEQVYDGIVDCLKKAQKKFDKNFVPKRQINLTGKQIRN